MRVETIRLLIPFTGVLLVAAPGSRACPRRCTCYVSTEVHCTFRYLTSIPDGIPPSVERVNLGYNSLARLTATDFPGLSKLELLLLHSNGIHTIAQGTFSDLQALQVLKMSYNKVQKLEKETFRGLRSLTRLHVDHNSVEFIHPEAFYGLGALRLLQLEGNRLTKLHPDTFVSLRFLRLFKTSSIKYLYLSDNFLPSLPQDMLSHMPALESLYLHGNPWVCDCRLKWLSGWMQERPDVIKCKKDRGPSGPQQCPACTNPRSVRGKPFALVPAAAFLCVAPAIDPALRPKGLKVPEDSGSASVSPREFLAPFGSLALNMTDQFGNTANVTCRVQKPLGTQPMAFTEEDHHILLNVSFSTFLECDVDSRDIQPVWHVLALYSDAPLILERSHLLPKTPQLHYKYKQAMPQPEDIFTNVEADLAADPAWLMQDQVSLQLNRTATTLGTLRIRYAGEAQVTLPVTETEPGKLKWTMILRSNDTTLEHTVLAGGTVTLDCPGHGDPSPHLEWLLADGSKVRAPYVSEDGRVLVDGSGRLELQMAEGSDTGVYHCVSTNYEDADVLGYRITVVEPHVEAPPERGVSRTVFAGDTLELPCSAAGSPDASVSWVLPGNSVLQGASEGKQMLHNSTLRIPQVTPQDRGHYRCVAANPSGVDFLLYRVSVKMKGQRPSEQDGDTDGSGLGEPSPSTGPRAPAVGGLPPSAPVGARAGKQVSRASKDERGGFVAPLRAGSVPQRLREPRRHFPTSARRVDPRHWSALLEKAKQSTVPVARSGTTAGPPMPGSQALGVPGEEGSLGAPPGQEEHLDPTEAPRAAARAGPAGPGVTAPSLVASRAAGAEASPGASPRVQPESPTGFQQPPAPAAPSRSVAPSRSSKGRGAASPGPATVLPPLPGVTGPQDLEQPGQRQNLPRTPPAAGRMVTGEVPVETPSGSDRADLESANTSCGNQTGVTGARETGSPYPPATRGRGAPGLPPEPRGSAPPSSRTPGLGAAGVRLPRRFGRRRTVWGRGRVISPHRPLTLRRHGYSAARPAVGASAEDSAPTPAAPERPVRCPPRPPPGGLASAAAVPSPPGSPPSTRANAEVARATAEPSAAPVQNPSLVEKRPQVSVEKVPAGTASSRAPTPGPLNKPLAAHDHSLSASTPSEARGQSGSAPPPPGPVTQPPVTALPMTRNSRRKVPWHQLFVNNHEQKGTLQNLPPFGWQRSTAAVLPRLSPALPTSDTAPVPSLTLSARLTQIPPVTLAAASHSTSPTPGAGHRPTGRKPPSPPLHPLPPTPAPRDPGTPSFHPVQTATLVSPRAAPVPLITHKAQATGPRPPGDPGESEPQRSRTDPGPSSSPGRSTGRPLSAAVTPVPAVAEPTVEPHVSAFTGPPLEDTGRTWGTVVLHSGALHLAVVPEGPPQEASWTPRSTVPSAAATSSKAPQQATAREAGVGPSPRPPLLSSSGPLVPVPTSLPTRQAAVTDRSTPPVFKMRTDTLVTLKESWRHEASLRQLVAGVTAPPQQPGARLRTGVTQVTYPSWARPPPTPALMTTKSQGSKWSPLSWPENQFGPKSYPEVAGKGRNAVTSESPTLSSLEATFRASDWDGQKTGKKASQNITTFQLLPADSLLRTVFQKPRMVGGNAASFTVPAHSDAFLPCTALGNPPPTIHWTRVLPGLELSKGKRNGRFQVHPNGTLSIQRVSVQDRGQYLCSASNPFGSDHLHVTLSVVSYPPRILERRREEMTVYSGSTVALTCRAEGRPSPTISWILANQSVVSESSVGKGQPLVTSDGTLVIRELSIYDRGFYQCVASSPAGQDSRLIRIQVIAAPPIILEQKRQVLEGRRGESLELPCTAEGTPRPRVHWVLSDGTELEPLQASSANLFLHANGTLHIRHLAPADGGTYECIATSSTGSERRVVTLRVQERETSPRIEVASQRWTQVNLGDQLLLNCSAAGEPTPRISWRLPSKAVVDQWHRTGSRLHVHPNGSLSIDWVTEDDSGNYMCVARSPRGDAAMPYTVAVVVQAPSTVTAATALRHSRTQLHCRVEGHPQVAWVTPAGALLRAPSSGGRVAIHANGTLEIRSTRLSDSGDFLCLARGAAGLRALAVRLRVLDLLRRPAFRSPGPEKVVAALGQPAALDCAADGHPPPEVAWELPDGMGLARGPQPSRYHMASNGSLLLPRATRRDAGQYRCTARNPVGHVQKLVLLEVGQKPVIAMHAPGTLRSRDGDSLWLHCVSAGVPRPRVTWSTPGGSVLDGPQGHGRYTLHENGTLVIREATAQDGGTYICRAQNSLGQALVTVPVVIVASPPRITTRPPRSITTRTGVALQLHCVALGVPKPEVTWEMPDHSWHSRARQGRSPGGQQSHPPGTLVLQNPQAADSGLYRCMARNALGSDHAATYIQVV